MVMPKSKAITVINNHRSLFFIFEACHKAPVPRRTTLSRAAETVNREYGTETMIGVCSSDLPGSDAVHKGVTDIFGKAIRFAIQIAAFGTWLNPIKSAGAGKYQDPFLHTSAAECFIMRLIGCLQRLRITQSEE